MSIRRMSVSSGWSSFCGASVGFAGTLLRSSAPWYGSLGGKTCLLEHPLLLAHLRQIPLEVPPVSAAVSSATSRGEAQAASCRLDFLHGVNLPGCRADPSPRGRLCAGADPQNTRGLIRPRQRPRPSSSRKDLAEIRRQHSLRTGKTATPQGVPPGRGIRCVEMLDETSNGNSSATPICRRTAITNGRTPGSAAGLAVWIPPPGEIQDARGELEIVIRSLPPPRWSAPGESPPAALRLDEYRKHA